MCILHRWGKWTQYNIWQKEKLLSQDWMICEGVEKKQKRTCLKCGKVQDEYVYLIKDVLA